jgi:hypothetical protein
MRDELVDRLEQLLGRNWLYLMLLTRLFFISLYLGKGIGNQLNETDVSSSKGGVVKVLISRLESLGDGSLADFATKFACGPVGDIDLV